MLLAKFPSVFCALALAMAAIGCQQSVHDMKIADLDLNDRKVLQHVRSNLSAPHGSAFSSYALFHWKGSKHYCGDVSEELGADPVTVGEAIQLVLAQQTQLDARRPNESASPSRAERRGMEIELLTNEIELLILERDALRVEPAPAEDDLQRLAAIDLQLNDMQAQRQSLADNR